MMRSSWRGWLCVASCLILLSVVACTYADDESQGKGKEQKGAKGKGGVVQVDLSQLPPDLAKQVMKYVGKGEAGDKGYKGFKGFKSFKDKSAPMEAKAAVKLPPGLARKPADHPGRVA